MYIFIHTIQSPDLFLYISRDVCKKQIEFLLRVEYMSGKKKLHLEDHPI